MKIYNSPDEFEKIDYAVVTSGTFDGVHVGHQKILSRIKDVAQKKGGETVLLTYWPHPRHVLYEDQSLHLLSSLEEKSVLLRKHKIDHLIIIPFTRQFASLSSDDFIENILVNKIGTKKLVIGYDHKFGRNRSGSFEELKKNGPKYGFEVEEIPEQDVDHVAVSSTKIRKALETGNIEKANKYLDRHYDVYGKVTNGDKIGRTLGFPTANIEVAFEHKLIPADGIYAVEVDVLDKSWKGMLNIGYRPTVHGSYKVMEVHIFNFDHDIYDHDIKVFFHKRIRDEVKFSGLPELKAQLAKDEKTVRSYFNI
jgi:riboflavin kinase/FMN adenylyltransferase